MANWQEIKTKLEDKLRIIFNGIDLNSLSDYEKRKIVFEYLTKTISYDYDTLNKIIDSNSRKKLFIRDYYEEFKSVMDNNKGICNSISLYYKMLLELLNIKSYCVACDNNEKTGHMLNIVYDKDRDLYSFDDITSVIVGQAGNDVFFDYDVKTANKYGQGNKLVTDDSYFIVMPDNMYDSSLGIENRECKFIGLDLPSNLASIKSKMTF